MKLTRLKTSTLALALGILPLAGFALSPALAQEAEAPPALSEAPPVLPAPPAPVIETVDVDPALWVVKDDDTTIYLFGTVHILKPGLGWFDDAVREAFDASDTLVLEMIEPGEAEMQTLVMAKAMGGTEGGLRAALTAEQKTTYEAALTSLSLPPASFDMFKPWFTGVTLGVMPLLQAGYDLNSGAEKVLSAQAKADGKPVVGLETAEQQLDFFDDLPQENQIAFLMATAESIDQVPAQIDSLVTEWGEGDAEELAVLMNAGMTDELLYDTLLTDRNATWAKWIDERMDQPGIVFVAVGAGHLAGEGSVQEQLEAYDLDAERVDY